ncbi:MAG TPA: DUF1186 domain-containing protein [Acetobacteraceae bacterium]|jgi:hypothetical protein|nr:DUF1186 domain-containing protein [Acetobacteraceae bacterium]
MSATLLTVDDAVQAFAAASDGPPVAALQWALDHWEQAAPRFLQLLDAYADGSDDSDDTTDALFFIIHLFGDKGDIRAFRNLCRLMLDEDRLVAALGDDACVETLKGVLIKCFDGDAAPLQQVIESAEAESITRGEALLALAWVARDGRWPEPAFSEYLRHLLATMQPREEDYVWYMWVVVAAILGYEELADASKQLIEDGLVPEEWLTLAELPELIATGDAVGKAGLIAEEVVPFDDVIGSLENWSWPGDDAEWDEPAPEPYINPLRHIGRNDPCPCGSGKKFKNCHLVAE